jgi:hypothetical protein
MTNADKEPEQAHRAHSPIARRSGKVSSTICPSMCSKPFGGRCSAGRGLREIAIHDSWSLAALGSELGAL